MGVTCGLPSFMMVPSLPNVGFSNKSTYFSGMFSAMAENIPEKYVDLLEKPTFGKLGTIMKDGSPQVTPIWVDYDGKYVRFNSALGRVTDKNVRRDPRVSISLQDRT